ncbi:MotA/TolQ/ExbB proton channel family protein [Ruficoccus sp. ZRK36]|uniref:MotA/TolQ/ExbB proton channel family protein n=1 Tax=Ruficoccus sp. ZRK36 TaxID=2866311 RepID=UPI001C735534|nr:MotA/TolQ/ExbB proton channel family protein [Ruficoccus sp. ZRK36]QYY37371.1 MotA/TolQ/ExbB proton channel family protein [Ruficoccus sp. ZRK36]
MWEKIIDIWDGGGWVMIPLALLAFMTYATAFQVLLYLFTTNLGKVNEEVWKKWIDNPEEGEGRVGEIIKYAMLGEGMQKNIRRRFDEVRLSVTGMIDRRVIFISSLVATAPLMGLLGTVIGMLLTFYGISQSGGAETAEVVADGIRKALITTQTGLTIALPGVFIVMVIQRKKHALEACLSRLESMVLTVSKAT